MAHYAAMGPASRLAVAEVVARYVIALAPLNQVGMVPSGSLPAVTQTAAALGTFYEMWETQGWFAALNHFGVQIQTDHTWETLIPALLGALAGPGAGLDEAVARTALLDHFAAMGLLADLAAPIAAAAAPPLPAAEGAWHFLALALYHRCIADLGETLEFYAPTVAEGRQRQEALKAHFLGQFNLLVPMLGDADAWESHPEIWLMNFIALLGNYDVR